MRIRRIATILGVAGVLAACGGQSPSAAPTDVPSSAPPTVQPTVPAATPADYPEPPAEDYPAPATPDLNTSEGSQAALENEARTRLANYLGVDAATLTLANAERQDWSDGSLGCPRPDTSYQQVVIPGFKLEFSDGTRSYQVHTALSATPGEPMLLCDLGMPTDLGAPAPGPDVAEEGRMMVQMAVDDLAARLQIDADAITVVSAQPMEWRDSSLGCPSPSESYMQVITPGYKIDLYVNDTLYPYHTDANSRVVLCQQA